MAFKVVISKEYRDHPSGMYRAKRVRVGSQFYGEVREYKLQDKGGRRIRIFWAAKLKGEFLSAMRAWALNKAVVSKLSEEGIPVSHVGVLVTANPKRSVSKREYVEETWIARWESFREGRRDLGMGHWAAPFSIFKVKFADIEDDVKIKSLKVSGR